MVAEKSHRVSVSSRNGNTMRDATRRDALSKRTNTQFVVLK